MQSTLGCILGFILGYSRTCVLDCTLMFEILNHFKLLGHQGCGTDENDQK